MTFPRLVYPELRFGTLPLHRNARTNFSSLRITCEASPNLPPPKTPLRQTSSVENSLPTSENNQNTPQSQPQPSTSSTTSSPDAPTDDRQSLQAGGLATGFPVPTGYVNQPSNRSKDGYDFFGKSPPPRIKRQVPLQEPSLPLDQQAPYPTIPYEHNRDLTEINNSNLNNPFARFGESSPIRPVFRTAPYRAEVLRQSQANTSTAQILFLDEGNTYRSILAAALLRLILAKLRVPLDVVVDTASIGLATAGQHDPRVLAVAREMGLKLERRHSRRFDEVADAVNYDLVIVMDKFDYQEILKEVSVLDTINPGGYYSARIRLLGPFGAAAKNAKPERIQDDISDSLYGIAESPEAEKAAVRATAKQLAFACRGLADYLLLLQSKCGPGMTLRKALAQSLQCPVLSSALVPAPERLSADFRPLWREESLEPGEYYTVRVVNGQRRVVRKRDKPRGYWRDEKNIDAELRLWMRQHGVLDRLPTQKELRKSGASSLAASIDASGGLAAIAERWGVSMASRKPNGYWDNFENLAEALKPFLLTRKKENGGGDERNDDDAVAYMPTQQELMNAGRSDLIRAIRYHGGTKVVGRKLSAKTRNVQLATEDDIVSELLQYVENKSEQQKQKMLLLSKRSPNSALANDITYKTSSSSLRRVMPTKAELEAAGLSDLAASITRHGGFRRFAARHGFVLSTNNGSFARLGSGNNASSSSYKTIHRMPSSSLSSSYNNNSSTSSISSLSSAASMTENESLADVACRGVLEFLKASNVPVSKYKMPTRSMLVLAGRDDLWTLIQRSGGAKRLAERLDLPFVETRGRRKKDDGDEYASGSNSESDGEGGASGGVLPKDAKEELDIVDAYEEFVII